MSELVLAIICIFGIIGGVTFCTGVNDMVIRERFIKTHLEKPYCDKSTATVLGRTQVLRRCFKVVEVDQATVPEESK
jgi:hypothetical protein